MSDWQKALTKPQLNQPIFNQILHTASTVKHQPLPKAEFPSGELYFKKFNDGQRAKAVVVHNNYIVGVAAKQQRFKLRGLWKRDEWQQSLPSREVGTTQRSLPTGKVETTPGGSIASRIFALLA